MLAQGRIIAENQLIWGAIRLQKVLAIEQRLAEARMSEDELFEQTLERLITALFARFKHYLPPLASLRERYSSKAIIARVEEYFDGEDLIALRKFIKRFMKKQPRKPRERDECEAMELAAAEIDRLERYESRAWSRQMRAIRSFIELSRT